MGFLANVYEGLVRRDVNLKIIRAGRALEVMEPPAGGFTCAKA